jgi:2-polyprenyl-3-methyl-5-hydroxy-6-metoxy-1,4-benzoquinol methylase
MSTERFEFGNNWKHYIASLREQHILAAERSLCQMLGRQRLDGLRFLDVGCGSGLFSLAALRLGATSVVSFDLDRDSVECAHVLSARYGYDSRWKIMKGDVLNLDFLKSLGTFDIVYSWGVLHHTGQMWQALENITVPVSKGGIVFVAIYNDQGSLSRFWTWEKRLYNFLPNFVRHMIAVPYYVLVLTLRTGSGLFHNRPVGQWYRSSERGMNLWIDTKDWLGGYPFESASSGALLEFFRDRNFVVQNVRLRKGSGCNEMVFRLPAEFGHSVGPFEVR